MTAPGYLVAAAIATSVWRGPPAHASKSSDARRWYSSLSAIRRPRPVTSTLQPSLMASWTAIDFKAHEMFDLDRAWPLIRRY